MVCFWSFARVRFPLILAKTRVKNKLLFFTFWSKSFFQNCIFVFPCLFCLRVRASNLGKFWTRNKPFILSGLIAEYNLLGSEIICRQIIVVSLVFLSSFAAFYQYFLDYSHPSKSIQNWIASLNPIWVTGQNPQNDFILVDVLIYWYSICCAKFITKE